jgi:hypothetical protein
VKTCITSWSSYRGNAGARTPLVCATCIMAARIKNEDSERGNDAALRGSFAFLVIEPEPCISSG